jgi:DHA1 family multidrug resistance protein-like MFS transporter
VADEIPWQRNLTFLWTAQVLSMIGFNFALPFAPFYLQELGITGRSELRLWSGLFAAGAGIPLAIAAPIWGAVADRVGRKPMSLRASLGGALVLAGMALARTPGMLLFFRLLQGVFTGTITANLTLVVANTPEKRLGFAIGIMNSAVFAGNALGPLAGGYCADLFGYRVSFLISSLSLVLSFLITLIFVKEQFVRPAPRGATLLPRRSLRQRVRGLHSAVAGFLPVVGLIALVGFAMYSALPIYPLLVRELAVPGLGVATQTGILNAAAGAAVVLAGILIGRLADRGGLAGLGAACAASAGAFTAALAAARSLWLLLPLRVAADFSSGGADPILNILLARRVNPERRGLAFGLAGSVRSAAWALGGLLGGVLSAYLGFWAVFVLGSAVFLIVAWLAARLARAVTANGQTPAR